MTRSSVFPGEGTGPSLSTMAVVTLSAAAAPFFIGSERRVLYLGSDEDIDLSRVVASIQGERSTKGGTFVNRGRAILNRGGHG